jgi:hypothetical protein
MLLRPATRGVFNTIRSDIAAQQGVLPNTIDWTSVSPGTAWRLAEEQFNAAQVGDASELRRRVESWHDDRNQRNPSN